MYKRMTKWNKGRGRGFEYSDGWFWTDNDGDPRGPYPTEEKAQAAQDSYDINNHLAEQEEKERIEKLIEEQGGEI